ncbi:MAG: class I SAM-dependent methyltransferase [Solirubrobacterales bacterium]
MELPWSDWSMHRAAIERVVAEITARRSPRVLELGAGASTVLLARAVRDAGGRMASVEHDPRWAGTVESLLEDAGLADTATVTHAPLAPLPDDLELPQVDGFEAPEDWYRWDAALEAAGEEVDVLIVDGPPAGERPQVLVRAPALGLRGLLSSTAAVVIDDSSRPAERQTVGLWRERLGPGYGVHDSDRAALISPRR